MSDIAAILLLLATDLCVFGVMTAYLVTRHKNTKLRAEREETLRQMEFEREEYKLSEQKLELGRRYRHDMRHHFAAIRGILAQGDTGQVEEYLDALEEGLGGIEQRGYCQNTVINAVLSNLLGRAERAGVDVRVQVNIPKDIPFEGSDVSILLANALENAVNACIRAEEGKRALTLSAECADGKFKCMIANSVAARVPLGQDGLPVAARTEEHGYGMASIRYIVQKYSGVLRCESAGESFSVRLVLFEKSDVRHKGRKKRVGTRALTAVPLGLVALLLSFNCMPATVSALEDVPVLGAAVAAGARFIVTPGLDVQLVRYCQSIDIPIFPGCTTATDYHAAFRLGLEVLKFFPAELSGGVAKIKALAAPFPMFRIMPTGGISLDNLSSYISCPAVCACGGSYMVTPELIENGRWKEITELCCKSVRLIKEARGE